ncbi:MAG: LysM peptidoglycan-binding domain-containing protein [Spirochaetota bacterium]
MRRVATTLMGLLLSLTFAPLLPASNEYVVRPGDTLYSIARRLNVGESAIREANGISDPRALSVGRRLVIPDTYTVERGDTYWSVARAFGMSVDELLEMNDRNTDTLLRVGDVLIVSAQDDADGAPSADAPDAVAESRTESGDGRSSEPDSEGASDSASEGEDSGPGAEGRPEPVVDTTLIRKSTQVAATKPLAAESVLWPHPGDRTAVDGKFPGVAISAGAGDAVYSVSTGRVIYSGPHTAFGRVVFVQTDDGYLYVYAGNSDLAVTVGDRVRVGTPIGRVGAGPNAEEAQLYFSVWKNNRYVDPNEAPRG